MPPSPPTTFRPPAPSTGEPEPEPGSRVVRFGAVVGAGVLAAAIATIPAGMRVAPAVPGDVPLDVWLTLAACATLPAIVAVAILRGAREGLRAFSGPQASASAFGFVLWLLGTFGVMAVLGAVLRATTHHHGLAGVTFAIFALVASLGIALVARRLSALAGRASPGVRSLLFAVTLVAFGVVLIAAGIALARAAPSKAPLPPSIGALFVDLLALAIASGFLSRAEFARRHVLALLGLPVAVGMIMLGFSFLHRSVLLEPKIVEHAPLYAPIVQLLGR